MIRAKNIFRIAFFAALLYLVIQINRKSDDQAESIAEFKLKMYKKIQTDSIGTRQKIDLMRNETTRFIENSEQVKTGTRRLFLIVLTWLGFELIVQIKSRKRRSQEP